MRVLPDERRAQIIKCLVEGMSIRGTVRVTGAAKNTVTKLLRDAGTCAGMFEAAFLRDLPCTKLQADEAWAFVRCKQKNVPHERQDDPTIGDVWVWSCIDADTKLVPAWVLGGRGVEGACELLCTLKHRLGDQRIQLSTDGLVAYQTGVMVAFPDGIDYGKLIKYYHGDANAYAASRRYSPAKCIAVDKATVCGTPNWRDISTSYVERLNLTHRMQMRRMTRLTNGFSKKRQNFAHALALHFAFYNWCRPHRSLGRGVTPAMAAGLIDKPLTALNLAQLIPDSEYARSKAPGIAPKPSKSK